MTSEQPDPWTQFNYAGAAPTETEAQEPAGSNTSRSPHSPSSPARSPANAPVTSGSVCPVAGILPPGTASPHQTNHTSPSSSTQSTALKRGSISRPKTRAARSLRPETHPLVPLFVITGVSLVLYSLFPTLFLVGCGFILAGVGLKLLPVLQSGLYVHLSKETQQLLELPLLDATRQIFANMTFSKTITALFLILPLPPDEVDAALARLAPAIRDRLTRRTADYFPPRLMQPPASQRAQSPSNQIQTITNADAHHRGSHTSTQLTHVPRVPPAFVDPDGPSLTAYLAHRRIMRLVSQMPRAPSTRALNAALVLALGLGLAHVRASPLARKWAVVLGHAVAFIIGWIAVISLAILRVRAAIRAH